MSALRVLIGCAEKPCPRGSVGYRGPNGRCRCAACNEFNRDRKQKWAASNQDRVRSHSEKWRRNNPEARDQAVKKWREANPERARQITLKAGAKWAKACIDKRAATRAKQRAKATSRIAAWADMEAIAAFYAEAARLTRETGVPHEVDHVIPLIGQNVCGLHVENNLQVVTRSQNRSKGRRFDG